MRFKNWGNNKTKKKDQIFDDLYHKYSSSFRGVCFRYIKSSAEADDILQEAYIKIYNNLDQLKDIKAFEAWGKRIIVNTALKNIKENNKNTHVKIEVADYEVSEEEEQASLSVMESLDITQLINLMKNLPEGYRTIMNLYAVEGYSHKEIAEMLDIKEASSRSQYFKAKKAFHHILLEKITEEEYGRFAI